MAKPATVVDVSAQMPNGMGDPDRAALERRLQRLEDAIANLADPRAMEDRIVERLGQHHPKETPAVPAEPVSAITTHLPPPTEAVASTTLSAMATLASAALNGPMLAHPAHTSPALDLLSEAKAIPRMFFDRQFRVGWGAKTVVLVLLPLLLLSQWWLPFAGFAIIGPIFDKVFVILAACAGYKVLSREAQRYLASKSSSYPE